MSFGLLHSSIAVFTCQVLFDTFGFDDFKLTVRLLLQIEIELASKLFQAELLGTFSFGHRFIVDLLWICMCIHTCGLQNTSLGLCFFIPFSYQ